MFFLLWHLQVYLLRQNTFCALLLAESLVLYHCLVAVASELFSNINLLKPFPTFLEDECHPKVSVPQNY